MLIVLLLDDSKSQQQMILIVDGKQFINDPRFVTRFTEWVVELRVLSRPTVLIMRLVLSLSNASKGFLYTVLITTSDTTERGCGEDRGGGT